MKNKVVLITGASKGIGRAVAKYLVEKGAKVILVARNKDALEEIRMEAPERIYTFTYDLMDLEHIESIFSFCSELGYKLDGMVHCAGINRDTAIRSNNIEDMQQVMTINYMSFVELSKFFVKKKYSTDGASIVAISSNAVNKNTAGMSVYTSSKVALETTVSILAKESIRRNIRVNAIAPACVDTDMIDSSAVVTRENILKVQPLGIIEPIYIAYTVEFLLSDKAKYITGISIPITSGN